MLSVDATLYPAPRIKLYTRCLFHGQRNFASWRKHLTLDDAISLNKDFEATCQELWESMAESQEWAKSQPESGPQYCLILYDLSVSPAHSSSPAAALLQPDISSKLYIMCQEIPREDSFLARKILDHCRLARSAPILRTFSELHLATNFICEIGLASRKEGIETSIYINPTVFSREDWMEDNLSFMSKYRIRPGHDGDETRNRVLH